MKPASRNPVAKHCRTFNRAARHHDRKKAAKRGYSKHRNKVTTY
jgi:hypothetical protein